MAVAFAAFFVLSGLSVSSVAQLPIVNIRFGNPQYNCATSQFIVDIEFKSNTANKEVFGSNIRFWYDDSILEFVNFFGFQGGYSAVTPNPPQVFTSTSAGPAWFNFTGAAEYIQGAIQKTNLNAPPIILETNSWKKLFSMTFAIDDQNADPESFCPSLVWDMEQDNANGGFFPGSDGVVITIVDPAGSQPTDEEVDQFNWQYTGSGGQPYGEPVEVICIPLGGDILVSNNNDSGNGSLRNAIACASDGDTLYFASGMAGQTIQITSTRIPVTKDLVIYANVSPKPKISSVIQGLFDINASANVQFRNLDIVSGLQGSPGAAFTNNGYLVLYDVNVLRHSSLPSGHPLIRNQPNSHLELRGICHLDWD